MLARLEGTPAWMTTAQAGEYLSTSPAALRRAESRGKLRGHRTVTGRVRFGREELDRYQTAGD